MNPWKACEIRLYQELRGGDDGLFSAPFMTELVAEAGSLQKLRNALAPCILSPNLPGRRISPVVSCALQSAINRGDASRSLP